MQLTPLNSKKRNKKKKKKEVQKEEEEEEEEAEDDDTMACHRLQLHEVATSCRSCLSPFCSLNCASHAVHVLSSENACKDRSMPTEWHEALPYLS